MVVIEEGSSQASHYHYLGFSGDSSWEANKNVSFLRNVLSLQKNSLPTVDVHKSPMVEESNSLEVCLMPTSSPALVSSGVASEGAKIGNR